MKCRALAPGNKCCPSRSYSLAPTDAIEDGHSIREVVRLDILYDGVVRAKPLKSLKGSRGQS